MSAVPEPAPTTAIDTRGIPTHECLNCGSRLFKIVASFEDYDIALWLLDAECAECGSPLTVVCPADDPNHDCLDGYDTD